MSREVLVVGVARIAEGLKTAPQGPRERVGRVPAQPLSGHVFRVERKRGPTWYAKYRLPDGRQVQRKIGPAWTERGRPATGYFTKRTAEDWLRDVFDQARHGTLPGLVRTGATVADAAAEYLRYIEHDRTRKPSTVQGYRWIVDARVVPELGNLRLEDVTAEQVEVWLVDMPGKPSTRRKALVLLHGIFQRTRRSTGCRSIQWPTSRSHHFSKAPI
jgi:integrase